MESKAKFTIHRNALRAANLMSDTDKNPTALGGVLVSQDGNNISVTATNGFSLFRCLQAGKLEEGKLPEDGIMIPAEEIKSKFPKKKITTVDFFDYGIREGTEEEMLTIVHSVEGGKMPVGIEEIPVMANVFPDVTEVVRDALVNVIPDSTKPSPNIEQKVGIELLLLIAQTFQVFHGGNKKFSPKNQKKPTHRTMSWKLGGKNRPFVCKSRNGQQLDAIIVVMPILDLN